MMSVAVGCALLGTVFLAFGTQKQGAAVLDQQGGSNLGSRGFAQLFRNPQWLLGLVLMVAGLGLNLVALGMAPLMVVQPLGALAVVITTLLNARRRATSVTASQWWSVALCVLGSALFVVFAVQATTSKSPTREEERTALILLGVVLAVVAVLVLILRRRPDHFTYVLIAGGLFAFVAVFTRIVLTSFASASGTLWDKVLAVNFLLLAGMAVAGLLGSWAIQNAYAHGPPDTVSAGMTVLDPVIGITIGITVLHEARAGLPPWMVLGLVVSALIAIGGVVSLALRHPEVAQIARNTRSETPRP